MASVRLQKLLAHAGVSSRRAAEELITAGRVRVDGRVVTELGTKVDSRSTRVEVDGVRVVRQSAVYIMLHKPRGVVSTMSDPEGRQTVKDLLTDVSAARVYPIGRLDFNTSGALLVTNDGDFSVALMHPSKAVPKTYVIKVNGKMSDSDVDLWRRGVELEDGKTLPAKVKLLRYEEGNKTWLELTIIEGRNQQIRRMGDVTGFRVMRLARLSFAGIGTEGLTPSQWRYLTADELSTLKKDFGVPKRVISPPKQDPQPRRALYRPASAGGAAARGPAGREGPGRGGRVREGGTEHRGAPGREATGRREGGTERRGPPGREATGRREGGTERRGPPGREATGREGGRVDGGRRAAAERRAAGARGAPDRGAPDRGASDRRPPDRGPSARRVPDGRGPRETAPRGDAGGRAPGRRRSAGGR
jgi:23S rRNA pseudouridine2605 synthase